MTIPNLLAPLLMLGATHEHTRLGGYLSSENDSWCVYSPSQSPYGFRLTWVDHDVIQSWINRVKQQEVTRVPIPMRDIAELNKLTALASGSLRIDHTNPKYNYNFHHFTMEGNYQFTMSCLRWLERQLPILDREVDALFRPKVTPTQ